MSKKEQKQLKKKGKIQDCFHCASYLEVAEAEPGMCDNFYSPNYEQNVKDMKKNHCVLFYKKR